MQDFNKAIDQMRFPHKLWYLINQCTDSILWGSTGRTILLNYRILQNYLQRGDSIFKTNNMSSFVRQLNLYGFRKVTSHLQDPLCNSSNPYLHEYMHDFFQYGRPELLNKIVRKTLTTKKVSIDRDMCPLLGLSPYATSLQKARLSLRMALNAAVQNLYYLNKKPCAGSIEDSSEEEFISSEQSSQMNPEAPCNITKDPLTENFQLDKSFNYEKYKQSNTNFMDVCGETSNTQMQYHNQTLGMPDLGSYYTQDDGGELLSQFHIKHDIDEGPVEINSENVEGINSLNCVLPSINNEITYNYDMMEIRDPISGTDDNGDWEDMFNDIINKHESHEVSSDLKKLYSQISRTIDLLNT